MKQFVPLSDDFPLETLQWPGQLVPYRCGIPCEHGLREAPMQAPRVRRSSEIGRPEVSRRLPKRHQMNR